jgi:hypothetical protein
MRIRTIEDYDAYFQKMVSMANFATFSFYKADMETLISDLKSGFIPPGFWLEDYESEIDDKVADNVLEYKAGAFNIISPAGSGNHELKRTILTTHYAYARKFIGKMRFDREEGLLNFDARNFRLFKIINFTSNNLCGVRVEFRIYDTVNPDLFYNETDWKAEL